MKSIKGKWESELGSVLDITSVENNVLTGTFTTHTGSTQGTYTMTGVIGFNDGEDLKGVGGSISWTVTWNEGKAPENSVTSWTGQYAQNSEGVYAISAVWLYCRGMTSSENWNSTLIGNNIFNRI